MSSLLVTPQYVPKTGHHASDILRAPDVPLSGRPIRNNYGVSDTALRRVFKANLERLMAANPSLDSGHKLEAKSGVGKSSIARWLENPPASAPTLDSLQAIARAFGVQAWELLVDENATDKYLVDRLLRRR